MADPTPIPVNPEASIVVTFVVPASRVIVIPLLPLKFNVEALSASKLVDSSFS